MLDLAKLYRLAGSESALVGAIQTLEYYYKTQVESAKKYLNSSHYDQFGHVQSENYEEEEAQIKWLMRGDDESKTEFGMELLDGQYTRQTLLEILFSKDEIVELHRLVKAKNKARNYHIKQNNGVAD